MKTDARTEKSRFGRLIERDDGRDFPYYAGEPIEVSVGNWVLVIVACVAGFLSLILIPQPDNIAALLPRILFPVIPLAVFILVTGRHWSAIFRRLSGWDFLNMVVFWLLNLAVTLAVGGIVKAVFGANPNAAAAGLGQNGPVDVAAFYVGTGIQLFGEEVFTILPFLAVLYFLFGKARLSRTTSVVLAWLITAAWFGAAHLPTYGWNFAQAFIVIGVARLVLTLAYIRTKNIAVPFGAHVLNDWTIFTFTLVTSIAIAS